jgi:predicted dienelactone hydrolase
MIRRVLRLTLFASVLVLPLRAHAWSAGVMRTTVSDATPFETLIWYPTSAEETPLHAGPFVIGAASNAPVAEGERFPVVLLSHGSGGTPMGHRELAASLARAGMIAIVPTHVGDSAGHTEARQAGRALADRPRQVRLALAAVLADTRISSHVDPARLGAIGYSAGGYTALVLAGAVPDVMRFAAHCEARPDDVGSCGRSGRSAPPTPPATGGDSAIPRLLLKALVLLDPLGVPFDAKGLAAVRMPVLMYQPEDDSYLSAAVNADAVAAALPMPPERRKVPGRHFVFIDPCPPELVADAPMICRDAPGVDRAAIHRRMETDIAEFLRHHL